MNQLQRAVVNGSLMPLEQAALPVTDAGVARGDGGFETVGVWDGKPFALDTHLERLNASLAAMGLPVTDPEELVAEAHRLCENVTVDAMLRVYVTASGNRVLTLDHLPPTLTDAHLEPIVAPWIRPLGTYGPAGAKSMSYMPNMAATRVAQAAGADDALLLSTEELVLEGPTFGVYWFTDGVLHAPGVSLGIIDSISRRTVLGFAEDQGMRVREGQWRLEDLGKADEVMMSSAARDVIAVRRVGGFSFTDPTPVRDALSSLLNAARRG